MSSSQLVNNGTHDGVSFIRRKFNECSSFLLKKVKTISGEMNALSRWLLVWGPLYGIATQAAAYGWNMLCAQFGFINVWNSGISTSGIFSIVCSVLVSPLLRTFACRSQFGIFEKYLGKAAGMILLSVSVMGGNLLADCGILLSCLIRVLDMAVFMVPRFVQERTTAIALCVGTVAAQILIGMCCFGPMYVGIFFLTNVPRFLSFLIVHSVAKDSFLHGTALHAGMNLVSIVSFFIFGW
jgi:hypothetical protein